MALAKNRELISISTPAHQHLKAVVAALRKSGIPTSGTMLASELILSIPFPEQSRAGVEKKRKAVKPQIAAVPAL